MMVEQSTVIKNPSGLHARPAAMLVKEAGAFQSKITLVKNDKEVDAKSILGIMSLAVQSGDAITLRAEGPDEQDAISRLCTLIDSGFGES